MDLLQPRLKNAEPVLAFQVQQDPDSEDGLFLAGIEVVSSQLAWRLLWGSCLKPAALAAAAQETVELLLYIHI